MSKLKFHTADISARAGSLFSDGNTDGDTRGTGLFTGG